MTDKKDAVDVLEEAEQEQEQAREYVRDGADFFHAHEGEMFERDQAREQLQDELDIDKGTAQSVLAELVGDNVDPVVQAMSGGAKYVGVPEYVEGDGWYGYLDYHDTQGKRKRVICAQCVHESEYDTEVAHATAGDPSGSFADQPNVDYEDLAEAVLDHYEDAHGGVKPEEVETGASLVSGTTIAGSTAWHAGNDGSNSGLVADTLRGKTASELTDEIAGWGQTFQLKKSATNVGSSASTKTMTTGPSRTDRRRRDRLFKIGFVSASGWCKVMKDGNTLYSTSGSLDKTWSATTSQTLTGSNTFTMKANCTSAWNEPTSEMNATMRFTMWK